MKIAMLARNRTFTHTNDLSKQPRSVVTKLGLWTPCGAT